MSKKLLEFNIPQPLPGDYDPILGRSIREVRAVSSEATFNAAKNVSQKTSVFDDPELDFAYQNPPKEELPQLSAEDVAILLKDDVASPEAAIIPEDVELAPEITPFETMDGAANEAINQAEEENNLSERWRLKDDEALEENKEEIIAEAVEANAQKDPEPVEPEIVDAETPAKEETPADNENLNVDIEPAEAKADEIATEDVAAAPNPEPETEPDSGVEAESEANIEAPLPAPPPETPEEKTEEKPEESATSETDAPHLIDAAEAAEVIPETIADETAPETETTQAAEINEPEVNPETPKEQETPKEIDAEPAHKAADTEAETETATETPTPELAQVAADEAANVPPKPKIRRPKGKKRRKTKRINDFALMGGVFFSGMAIMLLVSTLAAPLGRPFSDLSSYAIYWSVFALIGAIIWGIVRVWQMVAVSLLCFFIFAFNILPSLGDDPVGGKGDANIIGWANVDNSPQALQNFVSQGEKNGASLLVIAGANKLIAGNIPNWSVIQVPIANDNNSLAVLAKENWRAVTLPGEPTMARPLDNSITIIGVNPSDGAAKENAIINRAANRMGDQETPVLTIGDFGIVPWDRTIKDFVKTSGAKRVRCGGIFGTTFKSGLLGIATDHAFGFHAKVQKCVIGDNMPKSEHKPLFVSVLKH